MQCPCGLLRFGRRASASKISSKHLELFRFGPVPPKSWHDTVTWLPEGERVRPSLQEAVRVLLRHPSWSLKEAEGAPKGQCVKSFIAFRRATSMLASAGPERRARSPALSQVGQRPEGETTKTACSQLCASYGGPINIRLMTPQQKQHMANMHPRKRTSCRMRS